MTDHDLFGYWATALIESGHLSLGSAKIYQSMWNKFSKHIPANLALRNHSSQNLANLISKASEGSETSYPKRMAQLVSRVLTHHYGEQHLPAIELPAQFADIRRKDPVYLESPVVIQDEEDDGWKGIRDRAIAALTVYGGLRLHELMTLKIAQIKTDSAGYLINIKGQRPRQVPLAEGGNPLLHSWLMKRAELMKEQAGDEHVFISTASGKPITRLTVGRAIKRVLGEQGADAHGTNTATAARNTFAVRQLANGTNNAVISDWMGYKTDFTLDRHTEALKTKKVPASVSGNKKVRPTI